MSNQIVKEASYQEFYVKNDTVKLYCRRYGKGKPLLLIHGAACDCDFFATTAAYLARFYTVYTYDRRGYNRSSKPEKGDYSLTVQAEDAQKILDFIGAPCFIVAHSAGTLIAMELLSRFQPDIPGMLLHEPPTGNLFPAEGKPTQLKKEMLALIEKGKYHAAASKFLQLMGPMDPRTPQRSDEELEQNYENLLQTVRCELKDIYLYTPEYEALRSYPVLVAVGEHSSADEVNIVKETAKQLSCSMLYFPGQHNCAFDLPFEFAVNVRGALSFLESNY